MQITSPQSYLIKTKTNSGYYFYLSKDRTIVYKIFTEENRLYEEKVLVSSPVIDFAVNIDSNDNIHLVCITSEGLLNYYIHHKKKWSNRQISKLDIISNAYKNLVLILKNKITHILWNKTNFTNPALSSIEHIFWNDETTKKVTVTTYLPGKYLSPFQVDTDSMGNLHLVYKVLHKKNNQLYYSYFNGINGKWINGEIISNLQEDHSHPHILIDRNDHLHLVWCTIEDNSFTLKYKCKVGITNYKSKWTSIKNLTDSNTNNLSPILIQEGSVLKVFSKQNHRVHEIISDDFGVNWRSQKEVHLSFPDGLEADLDLIQYTSNAIEKHTNAINKVYAVITDSIWIVGNMLFEAIAVKPTAKIKPSSVRSPNVASSNINPQPSNITTSPDTDEKKEKDFTAMKQEEILKKNSSPNTEATSENIDKLYLDVKLKELVKEVQENINKMALEVEKLEKEKQPLESEVTPSKKENELKPSSFNGDFQSNLQDLNEDLNAIENEQFHLQKELDEFQKKIYLMEDRMIQFKKQLLEIEDKIIKMPSVESNFVSRLKNIFK